MTNTNEKKDNIHIFITPKVKPEKVHLWVTRTRIYKLLNQKGGSYEESNH